MSQKIPQVECQMLIRRPAKEVFEAFIDPQITHNFWFTKSSGRMEEGKTLVWEWEMYKATAEIKVNKIIENQFISFTWDDPSTTVEFEFKIIDNHSTYVVIRNYGFHQTGDELIEAIKNNTGGFTTVLDGLKAYLEHGIKLNLVGDKFAKM